MSPGDPMCLAATQEVPVCFVPQQAGGDSTCCGRVSLDHAPRSVTSR